MLVSLTFTIYKFPENFWIVQCASCLARELTSPRDVQSASWRIRIRELSSYRSFRV